MLYILYIYIQYIYITKNNTKWQQNVSIVKSPSFHWEQILFSLISLKASVMMLQTTIGFTVQHEQNKASDWLITQTSLCITL